MHAQSCTCMYMWHLIVTWLFRYLDLLAVLKANPRWFVFCVFRVSGILLTEQILHQSVRTLVSPPCPQTLILTWICPSRHDGQWTEILHAKFSRRSLPNIKVRGKGGKTKPNKAKTETKWCRISSVNRLGHQSVKLLDWVCFVLQAGSSA